MPSPTLKTVTLGCKVNQYETEYVRQGLLGLGYQDAAESEPADLCVVNTCTVTSEGDAKSRRIIRRLAKHNPEARIVVMGCYATRSPSEVAQLPGVYEVVTDKRELPDLLARYGATTAPTGIGEFQTGRRHRAFVKVQDGCLLNCSFCIIPQVRPHFASRPVEHIADEVRRLIDGGYRELVLTGIHLGHYGVEHNRGRPKTEWLRLSHLLRKLMELSGSFRVRLSSIEATEVTQELLDVMGEFGDRICPHLHISMQSGSDAVLRRMRRRWGARRFVDRCRLACEQLDLPALTTDVIVGFPGETEQDFADTCLACEQAGFSKIHIFPFSARPGTDAATMPHQVDPALKKDRTARLAELETRLRAQYFQRLVGRRLEVLVEGGYADTQRVEGTACRYAPVEFSGDAHTHGQLITVLAESANAERVFARAIVGK